VVSNGWIYIIDSLNKILQEPLEKIVFYDLNPIMIFTYTIMFDLLRISETR
jgi:hypothetical protein